MKNNKNQMPRGPNKRLNCFKLAPDLDDFLRDQSDRSGITKTELVENMIAMLKNLSPAARRMIWGMAGEANITIGQVIQELLEEYVSSSKGGARRGEVEGRAFFEAAQHATKGTSAKGRQLRPNAVKRTTEKREPEGLGA